MSVPMFPKVKSPFIRESRGGRYVVTSQIEPGYDWVFEDPRTAAVDKLHGSNVCVEIDRGRICNVYNRTQHLMEAPELRSDYKGHTARYLQGILQAADWGYLKPYMNDRHLVFGEMCGPTVNGNIHGLDTHVFVPFDYLRGKCAWKSWHDSRYPKTFEAISEWFKELPSLYAKRKGESGSLAEGLVFWNPEYGMAKLRRDMWDWYEGPEHG